MTKINLALAGLGFGLEFLPIYQDHPAIDRVSIFDIDQALARRYAAKFGIDKVYTTFGELLNDADLDAVHLATPSTLHEQEAIQVLGAGKHCACAVPMAVTMAGLKSVVRAARDSKKNYMMMETALFTHRFQHVSRIIEAEELGRIQFLRGAQYSNMENWPDYWMGLPPMHYATHAVAPVVYLAKARPIRVACMGSGTMRETLHTKYGNPYPVETAIVQFENGIAAEIMRCLFETAHVYSESFSVFGTKKTFEWEQVEGEPPVLMTMHDLPGYTGRGLPQTAERFVPSNLCRLLPAPIRKYTVAECDDAALYQSLDRDPNGSHGGGLPFLVHEFVCSISEGRRAFVNEDQSAYITAVGICAHESAMRGGVPIEIPEF